MMRLRNSTLVGAYLGVLVALIMPMPGIAHDVNYRAVSQDAGERLERPLVLSANKNPAGKVLEALSRASGVPIAIEGAFRPSDTISIEIQNGSLRDALNQIQDKLPVVTWRFEDGIVIISAVTGALRSFDVKLTSISVRSDEICNLESTLLNQTDLRQHLSIKHVQLLSASSPRGLGLSEIADYRSVEDANVKVVSYQPITLVDLLNDLLRQRLLIFWSIEFTDDDRRNAVLTVSPKTPCAN